MASIHAVVTSIRPIVMRERSQPYSVYLKGVDFLASPVYEIMFVYQAIVTAIGVVLFIPFCSFFFQSVLFGIAMMRILKDRLRNIAEPFNVDESGDPDHDLIAKRFRLSIELHKRIVCFIEELNSNVSTVFLIEIIVFGILLCALLFVVQVVEDPNAAVVAGIQCLLIIIQLFILYYFSNELIEQSNDLGTALYDSPWYCFDLKNRRTMMLILARMQQPMTIMVGDFAPITLKTFQSILNVSYTYFTVLRNTLVK